MLHFLSFGVDCSKLADSTSWSEYKFVLKQCRHRGCNYPVSPWAIIWQTSCFHHKLNFLAYIIVSLQSWSWKITFCSRSLKWYPNVASSGNFYVIPAYGSATWRSFPSKHIHPFLQSRYFAQENVIISLHFVEIQWRTHATLGAAMFNLSVTRCKPHRQALSTGGLPWIQVADRSVMKKICKWLKVGTLLIWGQLLLKRK